VLTIVTVSAAAQQRAWPDQIPLLRALAFRTNLLIVLPCFVAVHVFGDLLANREYEHGQPDWLDIGFAITDIDLIAGGVVLTLLQFWVLRRTRAGEPGGRPASLATILPWIVLAGLRRRNRPDGRETRRLTEPLRNACFSHVQKA
jgi:hypothetical protein